jgi:hypothetical protein
VDFSCYGKHQFPAKSHAERAARNKRRATEDIYQAYWCRSCRAWHVGESLGQMVRARREQRARA